jgi:hypothetical protein
LLLLTGSWSGASAQQPVSQGSAPAQTAWMFNFAPYLWLPTPRATSNYNLPDNLGARLPTDVSSGPGGYLSKLNAAAGKGPFSLLTDFMYTRYSASVAQTHIKFVDFLGRILRWPGRSSRNSCASPV